MEDRSRASPTPSGSPLLTPLTPLTPLTQPSHLPSPSSARLLLTLTSHAHAPPLHPPPDLKYDLRALPNPDKHTRDRCDGRSARLRGWLRADARYAALLDRAFEEVGAVGRAREAQAQAQAQVQRTGLESVGASDPEAGAQATVAVGVNCAMGRHRSVAFVEELSRRKWPREWVVVASHRDVDRPRGHGEKGRGTKHTGREVSESD